MVLISVLLCSISVFAQESVLPHDVRLLSDFKIMNGDAEGKNYSEKELLEYAKKSSQGQKQIVILMHDTYGKEKTVEMLPDLIDYYKSNGYEFKTIMSTKEQSG